MFKATCTTSFIHLSFWKVSLTLLRTQFLNWNHPVDDLDLFNLDNKINCLGKQTKK